MKNNKVLLLCISSILLLCGCFAYRISGRYGDGVAYESIDGVKTYRKFHIRSWKEVDRNGEQSFAASNVLDIINAIVPDMFNVQAVAGDIPVDIITHIGQTEQYGILSGILSLCTLFVIPDCSETAWPCNVEVLVEGCEQKLSVSCGFSYSISGSILPWGLIPYSNKDGYQENLCTVWDSPDQIALIRKAYIKGVAQQLKKHALERLTTPEIKFE